MQKRQRPEMEPLKIDRRQSRRFWSRGCNVGKRGPIPKPTAIKRLEGNPGKRRLPDDEPTPASLAAAPEPPDWLGPVAKQAWRAVARELAAASMLHTLDLSILELFAVTYGHWREMIAALPSAGHTKTFYDDNGNEKYSQATAEATQATKYGEQLNKLARVLGVGPANRVGLGIVVQATAAEDPIAQMLAGSPLSDPPKPVSKPPKPVRKPKTDRQRA
jgi:P27 family predicted phage terminase small subunit